MRDVFETITILSMSVTLSDHSYIDIYHVTGIGNGIKTRHHPCNARAPRTVARRGNNDCTFCMYTFVFIFFGIIIKSCSTIYRCMCIYTII